MATSDFSVVPGLTDLSVVLVEPTLPENVGAVARAMGNFGLRDLRLVRPCNHLDANALCVATHSAAVLRAARVFPDLAAAVGDRRFVVATSARGRDSRQASVPLPTIGAWLPARPGPTALLFGRESRGLTREELTCANLCVRIPTAEDASSLNLSHAVAVVLYALARGGAAEGGAGPRVPPARAEEVAGLKAHLLALLGRTGFVKARQADRVRRRFAGLLGRLRPTPAEVRLLRGFFHRIEVTLDRAGVPPAGEARDQSTPGAASASESASSKAKAP